MKGLLTGFFLLAITAVRAQLVPLTDLFAYERCAMLRSFEQTVFAPLPSDSTAGWLRWKTVANYAFGKNRGNITMINDLRALHPYFRAKVNQLIANCNAKGIELAVVETFRTKAKQNEYRAMGKKYTRSAGGSSKHQYGLAVDVVPMVDSVAVWSNLALWKKIGVAGEKLGLRWGGRWRHPFDPGHFEWAPGVTPQQLAQGIFPLPPPEHCTPELTEALERLADAWSAWESEQATLAKQPNR
jgi:hypothetical protein